MLCSDSAWALTPWIHRIAFSYHPRIHSRSACPVSWGVRDGSSTAITFPRGSLCQPTCATQIKHRRKAFLWITRVFSKSRRLYTTSKSFVISCALTGVDLRLKTQQNIQIFFSTENKFIRSSFFTKVCVSLDERKTKIWKFLFMGYLWDEISSNVH